LTFDGAGFTWRRCGVATQDEHTSIFITGDSLRVDELVLDSLEHVVAQVELHLEGEVGEAAPPAQGCDGVLENLFERHGTPLVVSRSPAPSSTSRVPPRPDRLHVRHGP